MRVVSMLNFDGWEEFSPTSINVPIPYIIADLAGSCGSPIGAQSNIGITQYNGRRWLCATGPKFGFILGQNNNKLASWFPKAKRVYYGARVYTRNTPDGKYLLIFDKYNSNYPGFCTVDSKREYFIEVVVDMATGSRMVYVNGSSFGLSTGDNNVDILIGSGATQPDSTKILPSSLTTLLINDYYCVIAEANDTPPARIGPCVVKTAKVASVTGDSAFSVTDKTKSIAEIISTPVQPTITPGTSPAVVTDPAGSMMCVNFALENPQDKPLGVQFRIMCSRKPVDSSEIKITAVTDAVTTTVIGPGTGDTVVTSPIPVQNSPDFDTMATLGISNMSFGINSKTSGT